MSKLWYVAAYIVFVFNFLLACTSFLIDVERVDVVNCLPMVHFKLPDFERSIV